MLREPTLADALSATIFQLALTSEDSNRAHL